MIRGLCFVCLLLAPTLFAQNEKWVEVRSPNFVVATDAGEKRGREVALHFEQMRAVFSQLLAREQIKLNAPLQVIAFKDRKGLSRVSPMWKGKPVELAGLYQGGEDKHFIALDLSSEGGWPVVFHEYAHLLLNSNFPRTEPWFDEGFAEYYSATRIDKKEVHIGDPPPNSLELLHQGLMPVAQLFSVVQQSDDYLKSGGRRSLFYAESWLMIHYLFDMKKLKEATMFFTLRRTQNMPVEAAMQQAFGMTPKEFDKALRDYFGSHNPIFYTMRTPGGIEEVTFNARHMKDFEAEATVADMQQHSPDHQAEAQQAFERILKDHPESAEAERGLGIAYLSKQQFDQAGEHFRRSGALGSKDPRVYYYVGYFLYRSVAGSATVDDPETLVDINNAINKAIDLDPEFADAYSLRAFALSRARNYAQAIEALKTAVRLSPRNEEYKLNLATQYLVANRYEDAIPLFEQLRSSTNPGIAERASAQMQTAKDYKANPMLAIAALPKDEDSEKWKKKAGSKEDSELKELEEAQHGRGEDRDKSPAPGTPVQFVKGTLVRVDCKGELQPSAVLTVTSGAKSYKFSSPNVAKMLVIGSEGFYCSWRNRKVSVTYHPTGVNTGDIVSLELY